MVLNPEPKFQDDIDEIHRSDAMTELGNYKKQYCDALMSIQRAKGLFIILSFLQGGVYYLSRDAFLAVFHPLPPPTWF